MEDDLLASSVTMDAINVTSSSVLPNPPEYPLYLKVALQLRNRVWPVIWCIGIVGNLLSAIVFSRKSFGSSTSALLFRFLSSTEFLYHLLFLTPIILDYNFNFESLERWNISCKIWLYLDRVLRDAAAWILVLISVERLVCVWKPHRVKLIFSRKTAIIATSVLYLFMSVINCPKLHLMNSTYFLQIDAYICITVSSSPGWKYYVKHVSAWIELLVYSVLPLVTMFFTNLAIIMILMVAARRRQQHASGGHIQNLSSMTATLLLVCFTYFCLSLPVCIYSLAGLPHGFPATAMVFYVETCKYANHALNFFLYCCSGARFRKELFHLFRCSKGSPAIPTASTRTQQNENL